MTVADDILRRLKKAGRPLTDAELAADLGKAHAAINQSARRLTDDGKTLRTKGPDGRIVSLVNKRAARRDLKKATVRAERKRRTEAKTGPLTGDQVKQAVKMYLESQGWTVTAAWAGRVRRPPSPRPAPHLRCHPRPGRTAPRGDTAASRPQGHLHDHEPVRAPVPESRDQVADALDDACQAATGVGILSGSAT